MTSNTFSDRSFASAPIRVGLVGTGYVAKARAQTLQSDGRSQLVAVSGYTPETTKAFCQEFGASFVPGWPELVGRDDLDLIVVSTINSDHGAIARSALERDKHVVVEYPLSLDPREAEACIDLARRRGKLLHVEHLELLGGLHNAIKDAIGAIGPVFYARYITINPQRPAPDRWTYRHSRFGHPFAGALSRLHRLTDLFGPVASVTGRNQFWNADADGDRFRSALCCARLTFTCETLGEAVYGKGETFWESENCFTLYGEDGTLIFTPEGGRLLRGDAPQPIEVGSRRGLFARDTQMVLDRLESGTPLYVSPEASLYTLRVADAVRRSAETGQTVVVEN
jgi:biliverdin reductase